MNGKYTRAKKQISENKKRKKNVKALFQCSNPFHFLEKHSDLSHQMPTPVLVQKVPLSGRPGVKKYPKFLPCTSFRVLTLSSTTVVNTCCPVTRTMLQEQTYPEGT